MSDDQQGDRGVGQSGARGFKRKGDRGLNPAFSSCFPRPGGTPEECVPRTRHGTYKSPAQSTAHTVLPRAGQKPRPQQARPVTSAVAPHPHDFRVAEAAGRGAHIRARRGPVYGVSWRGRRLGGRRRCPSGGLCPARMFPGLAAAAAAHRCSWAALCRLGGGRAATRGRSQGE